jgi:hypothetical protein
MCVKRDFGRGRKRKEVKEGKEAVDFFLVTKIGTKSGLKVLGVREEKGG